MLVSKEEYTYTLYSRVLSTLEQSRDISNIEYTAQELNAFRKLIIQPKRTLQIICSIFCFASLNKHGSIASNPFKSNIKTFYKLKHSKDLYKDFENVREYITSLKSLKELEHDRNGLIHCIANILWRYSEVKAGIEGAAMQYLIDVGYNISSKNGSGSTPLREAASNGNHETVEVLLKQPNIDPNEGKPILCAAPYYSEVVKKLLQHPKINIDVVGKDGNTAINLAAAACNAQTVELLIKAGANTNIQNIHGIAPLHTIICWDERRYEIRRDNALKIIEMLLRYEKTNHNVKSKHGYTALHFAIQKTSSHTLQFVKQVMNREWSKIDINAQANCGSTALHLMVSRYRFIKYNVDAPVTEFLFENEEIELNMRDKKGRTPLHLAAKHDIRYMVRFLIKHQAVDITLVDYKGRTALQVAIITHHYCVAKILLSLHAEAIQGVDIPTFLQDQVFKALGVYNAEVVNQILKCTYNTLSGAVQTIYTDLEMQPNQQYIGEFAYY